MATYPAGLASILAIEEEAWRHIWGQIDSDVGGSSSSSLAGTRAVTELHRMRQ